MQATTNRFTKKVILALIFSMGILSISAQTAEGERAALYGVQLSALPLSGLILFNEIPIKQKFSLKSELGLLGFLVFENVLHPSIKIEPRYYYNFDRRKQKGKPTAFSNGNYLALSCLYLYDELQLGDQDISITEHISVVPTYGLRRTFAKRFSYELGLGFGIQFVRNIEDTAFQRPDIAVNVHNRIGFRF